ncbi:MAG: hypothetical protein R6V45_03985 [Oceanipulchritudo sp.]
MNKKITTLAAISLSFGTLALANTPLLENTEFDGFDNWIIGSNIFTGNTWQAFVTAPDAYPFEERVAPEGDGFVFNSWDDGVSDKIETFLFQEWGAGPAGSPTATEFETGDVIVFRGSASATKSDPSDVVARAFIKTLGFVNDLAFQLKDEYTVFFPLTEDLQDFELSLTFPDLEVDDSLQVIQIGFEITTSFDGTNMDSGEIFFKDLEGFIEGDGTGMEWLGMPMDEDGWVNTGDWMGWVNAGDAPWVISATLDKYVFVDESSVTENGGWVYILGE